MAVRVTMNNARAGKNGVFLAKHNDGANGKAAKMGGLLYTWNHTEDQTRSFESVEAEFYAEHFSETLAAQNARYIEKRQKKRCMTMDQYRGSKRYCPESTAFYLGDRSEHADPKLLLQCVAEFLSWREERYPNVKTLNFAMHKEKGAPHIQERHVWMAHDEDGNETVCQEWALAEMGVLPPDPTAKVARWNNAKMTYTQECREKLQEIAKAHGLEITTEPREKGKQGLSQEEYITQDQARTIEDQDRKIKDQTKQIELNENALLLQAQDKTRLDKEIKERQAKVDDLEREFANDKDFPKWKKNERAKRKAETEKAIREAEANMPQQNAAPQPPDPPQPLDPLQLAREAYQNAPQSTIDEKPVPDPPKPKKRVKDDPHTVYGGLDKAAKNGSDEPPEGADELLRRIGIRLTP